MVEYMGAKAESKEIITVILLLFGLIIVGYVLIKRELTGGITAVASTITKPINEYVADVNQKRTEWIERIEEGVVPADIPVIDIPVLGEKDVYSIPSGGSDVMGSGEKEADFIDIGYGVLIPKNAYFYNIKLW